jgi:hypothetical protein
MAIGWGRLPAMSVYVSTTKQIASPHAWTFAGLAVDESGACYAAERNALRDIKAKGLLVRYPNPFKVGGEPEVLFESPDPFQSFWRTPTGELHVLGKKKHHFQVKGTFKNKEITKGAQWLVGIHGAGDRLIVTTGGPDACVEIANGEYVPLDVGLSTQCEDIAGTASDDLYVSSGEGITYFDGKKWTLLKGSPKNGHVVCVSRDEVFATGIDPEEGRVFAVYKGNAQSGFSRCRESGTTRARSKSERERVAVVRVADFGLSLPPTRGATKGRASSRRAG